MNQKVQRRAKMSKKASKEENVGGAGITALALMGILGLVLLGLGVYAIFFVSTLLGVILLVLGVLTYILFVIIEKRLKLL
jgi:hypothetical protein